MSNLLKINDYYFDQIDTQEKAYILGLLTADGCNYESIGNITIDLVQSDDYILEKIIEELNYEGKIHKYNETQKPFKNENGEIKNYECKPMSRLRFHSYHISKLLSEMGCISNKSKNGDFIKDINKYVPNELFNHYIRGLFDGNGGISYWEDNLNTHHLKFQINYCGTSEVVKDLSNFFAKKFGCSPAITDRWPDRDNNNLQVCISGNQLIKRILDWMYEDANIYLIRKHDKYIKLIKEVERVSQDNNLYGNAYPRKKVRYVPNNTVYESVTKAAKIFGVAPSVITNRCKKETNTDWEYFVS